MLSRANGNFNQHEGRLNYLYGESNVKLNRKSKNGKGDSQKSPLKPPPPDVRQTFQPSTETIKSTSGSVNKNQMQNTHYEKTHHHAQNLGANRI